MTVGVGAVGRVDDARLAGEDSRGGRGVLSSGHCIDWDFGESDWFGVRVLVVVKD